ncbi:MAG: lysophospholipid acyltransferase family protein [Bacteroidota bacterium]
MVFGILYVLSLMPWFLWYGISHLGYWVLKYGIKYRHHVIRDNIEQCFPEKSKEEHDKIIDGFYRHFCDLWVETIKGLSMSRSEVEKRVIIRNPEVWQELVDLKKGALLLAGHYANFELFGSRMDILSDGVKAGYCVYTPPKSHILDQLIIYSRARYNHRATHQRMIPRRKYVRKIHTFKEEPIFVVILGDQSPHKNQRAYYSQFLGRETAFFTSSARYAVEFGFELFFAEVEKVKRGYYAINFHKIPVKPSSSRRIETIHELTDTQIGFYERMIRKEPSYWLWSHKRWKRERTPKDTISPTLEANSMGI